MKLGIFVFLIVLLCGTPVAADPDCDGPDRWAASMTFVHLKNAGITDNEKIDFTKTQSIRLASENIGPDLYRQIHHVIYTQKDGTVIESIAINDASSKECSMSGVKVFVISNQLGP